MEPNAVSFHFWFHKSYKHMNPSFNEVLNSFHQQWWCCSISFGEWRKGIEAWATSDSKDQWIRWCCSGTIVVFVYLNKMSHWRSWKLKILFFNIICTAMLTWNRLCRHQNYLQLLLLLRFQKLFQMLAWKLLKLTFTKSMKPLL